jgi:hypothetical protein
MTVGPTLDEMLKKLPAAQRAAVQERAKVLIAEELSLRELRQALNLTQHDVAKRLAKGQEVVSRLEQRGDLLLSTLRNYIHSLGGQLELVCRFDERTAVRIQPGRVAPKRKEKRQAATARVL